MKKLLALLLAATGAVAQTPNPPSAFTASVPPAYLSIAGLHVVGNQILNSSGQAVPLKGVDVAGAAYECQSSPGSPTFDGPTDQTAINAMLAWGINLVRIPVNENCWLGVNGVPTNGQTAAQYQSTITTYINLLNSNGIAVLLDDQFSAPGTTEAYNNAPMPNSDHSVAFWTSAAGVYKTNASVIFDLFNEPWPDNNNDSTAAWTCLLNGGTCSGVTYTTVGMQALVTAVRGTGATNVIMSPGIQYENTLDQWLSYEPTDTLSPAQIAASWHSYTGQVCSAQTCWNTNILPVMNSVPLIVGEIGETDCGFTFINEMMDWLDAHGGNYAAWAWATYDCSGFPSLVSDYSGTPTGFGIGLRNHLLSITGQYPPSPAPVTYFSNTYPFGIGVGRSTNYTAADSTVYYPDVGNTNPGMTTNLTQGPYTPYTTADTITGTSDPTLYQSGRVGPYGYWYINVPNGTYNVTLGLAYNSTYNITSNTPTDPWGQDQYVVGQKEGTCWSTSFSGTNTYMDYTGGITGGSGYTNGVYTNVALTGGSGTGAQAKIIVAGGVVTTVITTTQGSGYVQGDVVSASIPGGSGFSATVTTLGPCPSVSTGLVPSVDTAYTVTYTVPVYNQQISIESGASFGGGRIALLSSIKIAQVAAGSPPSTPTGFSALVSGSNVNLSWTASTGSPQYYKVLRSTSNLGAYEPIATPETNSYSDTTVTHGTTYCYYLSAWSGAGYSANSSQACATP